MSRPATSQSRSRTRPGLSRRATSRSSVPYLPHGPADLVLPEGQIGEEAAELLHDFVHPTHHQADPTLVDADSDDDEDERMAVLERERMSPRPWYRRPNAWWYLGLTPISAMTATATMAPKIEILTRLACLEHRPEYTAGHGLEDLGIYNPIFGRPHKSNVVELATDAPTPFWQTFAGEGHDSVVFLPLANEPNTTIPATPEMCKKDPVVQAAVAKLQAVMNTSMGILGLLTVGFWASRSDRVGRTTIISLSVLGLLVQDFNFIFVSMFSRRLPAGYWFLIVGPLIEGCVGGLSAASASVHAYFADCTEPSGRSRAFSRMLGLLFIGMAFGPTLGGFLVARTGNLLAPFYVATAVHFAYAFVNWAIIPESLSAAQMRVAKRKHRADAEERAKADAARLRDGSWKTRVGIRARRLLGFAEPLLVLLPASVPVSPLPAPGVRNQKTRKDWSLTLIALAHAFTIMIMGSIGYKFQYAQSRFNWTSLQLGYWLSIVGFTRAFHLALLLPLVIRFLKPKPQPIQLPVAPEEPLEPSGPSSSAVAAGAAHAPSAPGAHLAHTPANTAFDLAVARVSLGIDFFAMIALALAPTGELFTAAAVLNSLGSGFGPSVQAVALDLYSRRGDAGGAGRLFGALSVLQALSSSVLGPSLFGALYFNTVAWFPQAIFYASAAAIASAFVALACVRLPRNDALEALAAGEGEQRPGIGREQTLVGESSEADGDVGRTKKTTTLVEVDE